MSDDRKYVWRKLKPLEQVRRENPGKWSKIYDEKVMVDYVSYDNQLSWGINSQMRRKFGNGNLYRFRRKDWNGDYTHAGDDSWAYSELWFEPKESDWINDEDFEL